MSARAALGATRLLLLALGASAGLGGCDLILRAASDDRHVDPRVDCSSGKCVCTGGFGDCDHNVDNGCETDLSQPDNCGGCGNVCTHGACTGGACVCNTGFFDCDHDAANGCEAQVAGDPKNCGVCHHDCGGGACLAGACQEAVFATVSGAETLGLANGLLYVGGCGSPPIVMFATIGGSAIPVAQATGCAHALSIADATLFWASDQQILASGLTSSAKPVQLAGGASPSKLLAGSATRVYWWDTPAAPSPHALVRVPAQGGAVETIVSAELTALTADATRAYWSDQDGVHVIAHAGTSMTLLSGSMHARALAVAVDGTTLYAADAAGIEALPLAGGAAMLVAAAKQATAITVDDTSVYWADTGDKTVWRAPLAGGTSTALATGQSFTPGAPIRVDDVAVYWLSGQEVRKIAK